MIRETSSAQCAVHPRHHRLRAAALGLAALLGAAPCSMAAVVTLTPVKDNAIYEDNTDNSNGAGAFLYSGETNFALSRRALVAFDVLAAVPSGSTITNVTLAMHVSRVGPFGPQNVTLQRLTTDWGEGPSDAGDPGGNGTAAFPGDATWLHNKYPDDIWANPGGDFDGTSSASVNVSAVGTVTWASTVRMVADVQGWLDAPAQNHGWLLLGDETAEGHASRFDSRENTASNRPKLTVTYTLPAGSGAVPDGQFVPGTGLTVAKIAGGNVMLSWGASCRGTDTDYEIYRGTLGSFSSYASLFCSTGGAATATFAPAPGGEFYLVVPTNGSIEGSYGKSSNGLERPPGSGACHPQTIGACF